MKWRISNTDLLHGISQIDDYKLNIKLGKFTTVLNYARSGWELLGNS